MVAIINGLVTPAKAGFIVSFWWKAPTGEWMDIIDDETDETGKATWRAGFGSWPQTFRASLVADQVIDDITYGGYTSLEVTLYDTQEVDLYLYPEQIDPPPPVEPEGVAAYTTVSPGKEGYDVELWWKKPDDEWAMLEEGITDATGTKLWPHYYFTFYPFTLRSYMPSQVLDDVEYGEYTSLESVVDDGDTAYMYLYPVPVTEEPPIYIETYRDVEIWYHPNTETYRAQVAPGWLAFGFTLQECKDLIDEILDFLENPPLDPGSILGQIMYQVMIWANENLATWLAPVYGVIEAGLTAAQTAWEGLVSEATTMINATIVMLTNLATEVGDRWDEFTTETLPDIWDTITTKVGEVSDALDTAVIDITEAREDAIVKVYEWVPTFLYGLIDGAFIADHPKYIADAMDPVLGKLIEDAVTSFWEGFEEGYAAG